MKGELSGLRQMNTELSSKLEHETTNSPGNWFQQNRFSSSANSLDKWIPTKIFFLALHYRRSDLGVGKSSVHRWCSQIQPMEASAPWLGGVMSTPVYRPFSPISFLLVAY